MQRNHFIVLMAQKTTDLVHEGKTFSVLKRHLIATCEIFEDDLTLLTRPHEVRSAVSAANFRLFVRALEGADPELSHDNCGALKLLCDEFKFAALGGRVQEFADRWASVVFEAETVHILRDALVRTCSAFRGDPSLLTRPYRVTSPVTADVFRTFVNALNGIGPTITNENVSDIGLLCEEFGHEQLSATVSEVLAQRSSPGERACRDLVALKAEIAALRAQVAALMAHHSASEREIAQLRDEIAVMKGKRAPLAEEVGQLRNEMNDVKGRQDPLLEQFGGLRKEMKGVTANRGPLLEEIGQMREAIRQMAAKMQNHFSPSVKKGGHFDVPTGSLRT